MHDRLTAVFQSKRGGNVQNDKGARADSAARI